MSRTAKIREFLGRRFPSASSEVMLRDFTTWRTGGQALLLSPRSRTMLCDMLGTMEEHEIQFFVLGMGSNILASDSGCDRVLIRLDPDLASVSWRQCDGGWLLRCGGGAHLPAVAGAACTKGAVGLEFAIGIPGTVGGAAFMNAGAYGSSISDHVRSVTVLDRWGSEDIIDVEDCGFDYRTSRFQKETLVIREVELFLPHGDPMGSRDRARELLELRRRKFPLEYPNAGSVFRKPEKNVPPGKLIEEAGLKGTVIGGAMVSRKHANFIVNTGGATSRDIALLIEHIRDRVLARSGIVLKEEIIYLGEEGIHG